MKQLIYSVEDDESIRELIKYALINEGYEASVFENAEDMLKALGEKLPQLILIDIMLPKMSGIEALKLIREQYKNVNIKIILLTAKCSEISKVSGLNDGADDYITKPFSVLELIARIKANLRKFDVDVNDGMLSFSGIVLNTSNRTVTIDGAAINLTYKEFELLQILVKNAGIILERERLLKEIWGYEYYGETRTVDIHIKNLRVKLGKYSDCIESVRGAGYILKAGGHI